MYSKFILMMCAIFIGTIGFSGGFYITNSYIIRENVSSVLSSEDKIIFENSLISEIDNEKGDQLPLSKIDAEVIPKQEEVKNDAQKIKKINSKCQTSKIEYEDESYLNVGQKVSLIDKMYVPSDLEEISANISVSSICLKSETNKAITSMINKARDDGQKIKVSSGFRNYTTQETILNRNLKKINSDTSVAVAKPGYSEHQLGTTVDLTGASIRYATASGKFAGSSEARWLEEYAYKYGFIESYPKGKENITGYMYEPWHYRYIGIENAKEIKESGQTINQFLKEKKDTLNKNTPL